MDPCLLSIVGNKSDSHIGNHLSLAAETLKIKHELIDTNNAFIGNKILRKVLWKLFKIPINLKSFSKTVVEKVTNNKSQMLITTGTAPLNFSGLKRLSEKKVISINYSTDDPWSAAHRAQWFFKAIIEYDKIFSTRKANLEQFTKLGAKAAYLPFGYNPMTFYINEPCVNTAEEAQAVFFAGACDHDRKGIFKHLLHHKIPLSLWGGFWEKYGLESGGLLDSANIRAETARCMVSLILVRRANRDGSAMRSFEIPACGGCCVAEDTEEHREMFGPDGEAVLYFRTPEQLVRRIKEAFGNPELRARLRRNAHRAITGKPNTYVERLKTILEVVGESSWKSEKKDNQS